MVEAVSSFVSDVRLRRFPAEEHCYTMPRGERERFLASLDRGYGTTRLS
jgi:hypothetical protein